MEYVGERKIEKGREEIGEVRRGRKRALHYLTCIHLQACMCIYMA